MLSGSPPRRCVFMIFLKNSALVVFFASVAGVFAHQQATATPDTFVRKSSFSKPFYQGALPEDVHQTLLNNNCLFEGTEERIFELFQINNAIPSKFHKLFIVLSEHDLERSLMIQALAVALRRPIYIIDFKQRLLQKNPVPLLGTPHGNINAQPGELFNAIATTNCANPIIILANLHHLNREDFLDLEKVLCGTESIVDAYLDLELDTHAITFMATAQNANGIPEEFTKKFDSRLIFIETPTFCRESKQEIAARFFLPELLEEHGLTKDQIPNLEQLISLVVDATAPATAGEGLRALKSGLAKVIFQFLANNLNAEAPTPLDPESILNMLKAQESPDKVVIDVPDHAARVIKQKLMDSPLNIHAYKNAVANFPWHTPTIQPLNLLETFNTLSRKLSCIDPQKQAAFLFLNGYQQTPPQHKKALCIVGAAGTGKTTFAQLIAQASGRASQCVNLAHHPSLTGDPMISREASPGEIFKAMCATKTQAPAVVLDNIDKAHQINTMALAKILSPKENTNFVDLFIEFPIDISNILFITTATDIASIPDEILEHLECIYLDGYSAEQREHIIGQDLLPRTLQDRSIPEQALKEILSCIPKLNEIVAPGAKGLHELWRATTSLVSQEIALVLSAGKTLGLTPETLRSFLDPQLCTHHVSEAKNVRAQCNEILKTLNLTPEQFKKINNRLTSLKPWKGGDALTLLYINWIAKFPFNKAVDQSLPSLAAAQAQLDKTHAGLRYVKTNILDYLAGYAASNQSSTKTLCFSGAPGVGKTTVAESIATALGRKFTKISFGGLVSLSSQATGNHDDLSGPGPIAKAFMDTGCQNPVILLDEIDKAPAHLIPQLLEILDPSQNKAFTDRYLGFEMDLSHVFFIATANEVANIAWPLQNRMQMIGMYPYTRAERIEIAQLKLVPQIITQFNLTPELAQNLQTFIEPLVDVLITSEYGVRVLNRALITAAEKLLVQTSLPDAQQQVSVLDVVRSLNPELLQQPKPDFSTSAVGKALGMYANGADGGGAHAKIAAVVPYGSGKLILPDNHGKSSQESYRRVLAFIKINAQRYGIPASTVKENDFVISDEDYCPTEGPSAGLVTTTALISAITKRPVRQNIAMTGAMDINGNTIGVNGYREKILGSAREGLKKFIVPECARPVIEALKDDFKDLEISYVSHIDQALDVLLEPAPSTDQP